MQNVNEPWVLTPFEGVGPLRFGMTPEQVRQALGEEPRVLTTGEESYRGAGVRVEYDGDERLELIQAHERRTVSYRGLALRPGLPLDAVVQVLQGVGLTERDDGEGARWFEDDGFYLYAPEGRLEGVGLFPRGYDTPLS